MSRNRLVTYNLIPSFIPQENFSSKNNGQLPFILADKIMADRELMNDGYSYFIVNQELLIDNKAKNSVDRQLPIDNSFMIYVDRQLPIDIKKTFFVNRKCLNDINAIIAMEWKLPIFYSNNCNIQIIKLSILKYYTIIIK